MSSVKSNCSWYTSVGSCADTSASTTGAAAILLLCVNAREIGVMRETTLRVEVVGYDTMGRSKHRRLGVGRRVRHIGGEDAATIVTYGSSTLAAEKNCSSSLSDLLYGTRHHRIASSTNRVC